MSKPSLAILGILSLALIAPTAPASGQVHSVLGTWTGTASQNSGSDGYQVVLTLTKHGGTTDYPALNCGGTLIQVGTADGFVFYVETITRGGVDSGGDCIDGTITVSPTGDQLVWGWVGHYKGDVYVAWSKLSRK